MNISLQVGLKSAKLLQSLVHILKWAFIWAICERKNCQKLHCFVALRDKDRI